MKLVNECTIDLICSFMC